MTHDPIAQRRSNGFLKSMDEGSTPSRVSIPEEFKKELDSHSSEGDPYFVFEYSDKFLDIASTFDIPRNSHERWVQCYLTVRPDGGLRFKNEPWV